MIHFKKTTITSGFVIALFCVSFSSVIIAQPPKEMIIILGYLSNVPDKLWQNSHVGFGIQNQLKQDIFNSERFNLKEEKNLTNSNNDSFNLIEETESWMLSSSDISKKNLKNRADSSDVGLIFWVEVVDFGNLKSKLLFGPFSSSTKKTTLIAKVCVFIKQTESVKCETGIGKSKRKSSSFIYTKKDHRQGEKMYDGSLVGKISLLAVQKAMVKLLEKI